MKLRSLTLLLVAWLALPRAVLADPCLSGLLEAEFHPHEGTSLGFRFHRGQKATLRIGAGEPDRVAYFLGRSTSPEATHAPQLIFHEPSSGDLYVLPEAETRLTERGSSARQGDGGMAPLIEIPKQVAGTCASHSFASCVQLLKETGQGPQGAEGYSREEVFGLVEPILSKQLGETRSTDFNRAQQLENQRQLIGRLFEGHREINSADPVFKDSLLQHLEKGGLAIIDYKTAAPLQIERRVNQPGKPPRQETFHQSPPDGRGPYAHSVLATGLIPYPPGKRSLVILDSGSGKVLLWDEDKLNAWQGRPGNEAFLVDPRKKAPAIGKRTYRLPGDRAAYVDAAKPPGSAEIVKDTLRITGNYEAAVGQRIQATNEVSGRATSVKGVILDSKPGQITVVDPATGVVTSLNPRFSHVHSITVQPPQLARWKQVVDHAAQLTFGNQGGNKSDKPTALGLAPGYWVFEIRQMDGTTHLIDPNLKKYVNDLEVHLTGTGPASSGVIEEFKGLTVPHRIVEVDRGRILRGSGIPFGQGTHPLPHPIDSMDWPMDRLRHFIALLSAREAPFSIIDIHGKRHTHLRPTLATPTHELDFTDQNTGQRIQLKEHELRLIFEEAVPPDPVPSLTLGGRDYLEYLGK